MQNSGTILSDDSKRKQINLPCNENQNEQCKRQTKTSQQFELGINWQLIEISPPII